MLKMIVILFLVISLFNIKLAPKGNFFEDNFSISDTRALKGFFAIAVILHHLCTYLSDSFTSLRFFENLGFLAVGGFFLISGYGLMCGVKYKPEYLRGFFRKRFLAVLIPYYLIIPFYFLVRAIAKTLTRTYVIESLLGISLWYAGAIAVLYIAFFISFRIFGNKWGRVSVSVLTALYAFTLLVLYRHGNMNFGFWCYNSLTCFIIGIWYCDFREKINGFVKNHYGFSVAAAAILFCIFWFVSFKNPNDARRLYVLAAESLCSASFAGLIIILSMKIRLGNNLLSFCGDLSFELYLTHALWIYILRCGATILSHKIYISSPDLFCAGVLIATVITAFVMHKVAIFIHHPIKTRIRIAK